MALKTWRHALWQASGNGPGHGWQLLAAWLTVAFILRSAIALGTDFTIHPDEIMQYLEPAHRAVFGNGIVTWAYQYGARNWVVPGFVATMLWTLDQVGLGVPWVYVYVVKVAFCTLSLLVPWGAYHFARRTLGSESAKFALVLTCLWPYLVVYAHKPFTEFVATSLLFLALGLACRPGGDSRRRAFAIGAVLVLAAAVRIQYLPLAVLVWLAQVAGAGKNWAFFSVVGGAMMVMLVALLETFTWGSPFHSYYWYFASNLEVNSMGARDERTNLFYLLKLLPATAGGLLLAVYAMARHPLRHLLFTAMAATVLVLHATQPQKEFRFVFVLLPVLLTIMADQFALWSGRVPKLINTRTVSVLVGLLLATFIGVFFSSKHAIYRENLINEMPHLWHHHNMFDIYLELARLEDVKGVLHGGLDLYFDTPGYYYLHHDVPLYNYHLYKSVTKDIDLVDPKAFFSHLLVVGAFPEGGDFVEIGGEPDGYSYGFLENVDQVKQWEQNTPIAINKAFDIASRNLGTRNYFEDLMKSSPELIVYE